MEVEVSQATPFLWFAGHFWCGVVFHLVTGLVFWLTKGGRWAELIGG